MAKRRPSGDGMVRKREDGRWEGRIVVGHKKNGNSIFRHVYAKTQKELLDKLHRNIEDYHDVDLTEDSRMTLGDWLDRWMAEYKADTVRPGTLRSYRTLIEQYIKPQLGGKQVSLITTQDVQRMYRRLKKEGRANEHPEKGNQLADSTVRGVHCVLHLAMQDAVQAHMIAKNPTEGATIPKQSGSAKRVLNDRELDAFLAIIEGDEIWHDFRHPVPAKRHGREDPLRHAGACVGSHHAGHLYPHHGRYAAHRRRQHRPGYRQGGGNQRQRNDCRRTGRKAKDDRLPALLGAQAQTRHRLR